MGSPALLAAQSGKVLLAANQSSAAFYRRVDVGGFVDDNGSAAAAWVVTVTIDWTRQLITSTSGSYEIAAAAAQSAPETWTNSTGAIARDNVAAVLHVCQSGTPVLAAFWGAEAEPGAAVAPSDAEISAGLGHNDWVRAANVLAESTGAAAVTVTVDNTARSGVVASGFDGDLATTEAAFNA